MRNLIVLSDGTGNSASASSKTNVWRIYQALDMTDGTQLAEFGDGVGTSSFKPLQVLGLALGIGVKRNVINLYKFLCRSYGDHDQIWCFGFSRGAFTVRALIGLINHEGLVSFKSEEELERNAVAAYRAYRAKTFPTLLPWVVVGRIVRDAAIYLWNKAIGARTYSEIKRETLDKHRSIIDIHFVGVWDTVVAYGLPVDELTQAVDKWVWPMKFRDQSLLHNVRYARHALSIDDERRTFFPIPWDETEERRLRQQDPALPHDRLLQAWFAGVHANVGGGYPDDSLAYVPLCWMIEHAGAKGLRFKKEIVAEFVGLASVTGRIYDSRSGVGAFYRYQPRDASVLMGGGNRPLVHHSVITRMALGADGYAPISLPYDIDVLPRYGAPIPFNAAAAAELIPALQPPPTVLPGEAAADLRNQKEQLLDNIIQLDTAAASTDRAPLVGLVLDTVWWRRLIYFVSLALSLVIVAYPLVGTSIQESTDAIGANQGDIAARFLVDEIAGVIKGFLPGYAEPWVNALVNSPAPAVFILVLLAGSLALSAMLQRRIRDRSRAAWRVQSRIDNITLDRLRLTGQRRAAARGTILFALLSFAAFYIPETALWIRVAFGVLLMACGAFFFWRTYSEAGSIDAAHPGFLLNLARRLRTTPAILRTYRIVAKTMVPALFLMICGAVALTLVHRLAYDFYNATGSICTATSPAAADEKIGKATQRFETKQLCHATGLNLIKGRHYRITLTIQDEWFDKSIWTDVRGFRADSLRHYTAFPLKRWWTKNWFQPIARVGATGNFEYALEPDSALPAPPLQDCKDPLATQPSFLEGLRTVREPASKQSQDRIMQCGGKKLRPEKMLIADIVPRTSGELFLYVNDASLLLWPNSLTLFSDNNSGTADVEVSRIVAGAVVTGD